MLQLLPCPHPSSHAVHLKGRCDRPSRTTQRILCHHASTSAAAPEAMEISQLLGDRKDFQGHKIIFGTVILKCTAGTLLCMHKVFKYQNKKCLFLEWKCWRLSCGGWCFKDSHRWGYRPAQKAKDEGDTEECIQCKCWERNQAGSPVTFPSHWFLLKVSSKKKGKYIFSQTKSILEEWHIRNVDASKELHRSPVTCVSFTIYVSRATFSYSLPVARESIKPRGVWCFRNSILGKWLLVHNYMFRLANTCYIIMQC